jgi:glycosyltransferase involved in cell wall biosynthesis
LTDEMELTEKDLTMPKSQVAIMLCTMNGQRFLSDQLESIRDQSVVDWQLWVSDDGSRDKTIAILEQFRTLCGRDRVTICLGPYRGFAANFLSLTCNTEIQADYYAYADQDDVWEEDKLARALSWLGTVPANLPALYCSRTRLVDEYGRDIGLSPLFSKAPSFANALMQNIGGGNTMVFNRAARSLLLEAGWDLDIVTHDWWVYMLVSGCGGKVMYDPESTVRYRQHGANIVGSNVNWPARILRVRMLLDGRFRDWSIRNLRALQGVRHLLTPENRWRLDVWAKCRQKRLFSRLVNVYRSGIYRQTLAGNLGLLVAAVFRRL